MIAEKFSINETSGTYLLRYGFTPFPDEMPNVIKRPAVVVCPGGGYMYCSPREADPVAFQFLAAGYQTFVLEYSTMEYAVFPNSLLDLCTAMKWIRENAEKFGIISDQIAVCGFSAGGHLAASLGVYWNDPEIMERSGCKKGENKPNALILGYPVISTSWLENSNNLARVIGDNDWDSTYKKLNLHTAVTATTPQTFLCHTVRDSCVPAMDSMKFATALMEAGVPCELHLFPNGGHGLSLSTPQVNVGGGDASFAQWVGLALAWLERLLHNPEEAAVPLNMARYSAKY